MIKAVIVDDESRAVESLKWEISQFCKEIVVVESFTDPEEAVSGINYLKPDCVFLDIEMPQLDGFQLLERLNFRNFDLIFTTAYDSYALKAFRQNAIDYLLKPIDSDDLLKAVAKIRLNKDSNNLGAEVRKALELLQHQRKAKIALSFVDKTTFVKIEDIVYCKSDGNYTHIFLKGEKKEVLSKKIKEVEAMIGSSNFYRTHNSYLVNLSCVREFIKSDGQYLVLEDGSNIPISRSRKSDLLQLLDS